MSRLFVCISGNSLEKCLVQAKDKPCAELRLDLCKLSKVEISELWEASSQWILTLRAEYLKTEEWKSIFKHALTLKPVYVDLDCELPSGVLKEVTQWVKNEGLILMLSYHNFTETPELDELNEVIYQLKAEGADVVKIACMANSEEDNLTIMDLYTQHPRLVAFCMGDLGRESRVTALFYGEKMTYVAPTESELVAPGQWTYAELSEILNLGYEN